MTTVDIIIPCYNYGRYLTACVESVLAQRDVNVRALIVDDASTDETPAIGQALASRDHRVEFRRHAINRGHIATYNEGIAWTRAEYMLILSADDALTPGALARVTRIMNDNPEITLAYGRDIPFSGDAPPGPAGDAERCTWRTYSYRQFLAMSCDIGHTPIQSPTAVVRTSAQKRAGGYRPDHPHSGDTEAWLRVAAQGLVLEVDSHQAFRRVHARNMSWTFSSLARLIEHQRAFDVHFDEHWALLHDCDRLRARVNVTLAKAAFWEGAHAFDRGDDALCAECLEFAVSRHPAICLTAEWGRLAWKRRIGTRAWRVLRPISDVVRQAARYAPEQAAGTR
jgi:glycosyltransferase involved in cell wall biosynthesis